MSGDCDQATGLVTIACVGDSIARGTFVWRRKRHAYPVQLQAMLGEGFRVHNFGVNGHAAQRSADRPYWGSEEYTSSSTVRPDVVLIMLGTNDVRGDNWKDVASFAADYRDLVLHYMSLESHPRIWLLTPPTLFRVGRSTKVRYGMDDSALREICDVIRRCANELGCGLIDINAVTAHRPDAFRFDGVHPGGAGATLIAQVVHDALTNPASGEV